LKLGIVGVGVVGGALRDWFIKNTMHTLELFDMDKGYFDELTDCKYVFICVPAPTNKDGSQDISTLISAIDRARKQAPKSTVFVRSTVLPGTCDMFKNVYAMPEFLTERRAEQDMDQLNIVVGGRGKVDIDPSLFLGKRIMQYTNHEAEMIKYAHNCFGAYKVHFFNIIYDLCQRQHRSLDYKNILEGMSVSRLIDLDNHTQVPGPDGKLGFGGHCFPKDLKAFATAYEIDSLLKISKENEVIRGS
jgi:UDPglucose 6-dehydrogenase